MKSDNPAFAPVDLLTAEPAAYRELTGRETFERAWKRTERLSTRAAQSA